MTCFILNWGVCEELNQKVALKADKVSSSVGIGLCFCPTKHPHPQDSKIQGRPGGNVPVEGLSTALKDNLDPEPQ